MPKNLTPDFEVIMERERERIRNHGIKRPPYDEREISEINAEEESYVEKQIQEVAATVHGVEDVVDTYPLQISGIPQVNAERSVEADDGKEVSSTTRHECTTTEDEKGSMCTEPVEALAYGQLTMWIKQLRKRPA